jgi:protease-4
MKRLLKWVAIICGIFLILIFVAYLFINALFDTEPAVDQNSYLQISLGGGIPEYDPPDAFEEYFRGTSLDMKKIRQSMKMATVDDRIKGVVLKIGFLRTGFAKLAEIQQLIENFRVSGKKVYAHFDYGLTRDYFLASACDSIYISPGGNLFLTGIAAEVTFYKGLLKKLGVEADFEHVGEYKNAPDMYTRQTMSEYQREVIDDILDSRYNELVHTIAENRGFSPEKVRFFIEEVSGFSPEEAFEQGLVDGVKYIDEVKELLKGDSKRISQISATEYSLIDPSSVDLEGEERIAVIFCTGAMTGGEDGTDPVFGRTMGANRVIRDIKRAAESSSIKAIILRINSPGGSSLAADQIWHAVAEAQKEKPVIASISDIGASGGYYIALGADTILAQNLSLIGSIGVYAGKFSLKNLYEKIELNNVYIKRGKNAGIFSLNSKFTDSERIVIQRMIKDFYFKFVTKVADNRNRSYDEIDQVARGRVWNGLKGIDIDLIDMIGGLDEAIDVAKDLAGIEDETTIRLIYFPKSRSFFSQLFSRIYVFSKFVINPIDQLEEYLQEIQMRPLLLMPFTLR